MRLNQLVPELQARIFTAGDYRATFETEHGHRVLVDLHRFIEHAEPALEPTLYTAGYADGQRRVLRRIAKLIGMDTERMARLALEADHED